MERKLIEDIANAWQACNNCEAMLDRGCPNPDLTAENLDTHKEHVHRLVTNCLPSGSGFNRGTTLDWERCKEGVLRFKVDFHHMNEAGYYDGWTEHTVFVRPAFIGLDIRVTGSNRNQIKDYIHDVFYEALMNVADRAHLNPWVNRKKVQA